MSSPSDDEGRAPIEAPSPAVHDQPISEDPPPESAGLAAGTTSVGEPLAVAPPGTSKSAPAAEPELRGLLEHLAQANQAWPGRLASLETAVARLAADAQERDEQRRNREALYERLDASRTAFHLQLMRPLLQGLAMFYDRLRELSRCASEAAEMRQGLELLCGHFQEVLRAQGVESVQPQRGEAFNPRLHYIVATQPAQDPAQHSHIAEVILPGFVFFGQHDRTGEITPTVVRPARVVTWKYDPSTAPESPPQPRPEDASPAGPGLERAACESAAGQASQPEQEA